VNRRKFITATAAMTGAAFLTRWPETISAEAIKKYANDRLTLGPMKIPVTRLAMGTGTNGVGGSSNQTRQLGLGGMADLLQDGFDQGVTFWDSADQYGSHPHLKEGLKRVPRDKVTILTKTHASTEKEAIADIDRFRRELGTDYLDILLLHCMTDARWPEQKKGAMAAIAEAQEKGIVRTRGVSCRRAVWRQSPRAPSGLLPT